MGADVDVLEDDFDASLFEFRLGRGGGGDDAAGTEVVTPKSAPNDVDELTAFSVGFALAVGGVDFLPNVFTALSVLNVGIIGECDSVSEASE